MYVFNHSVAVFGGDVVVAEIPITFYSQAVKPLQRAFHILTGHAEKSRVNVILGAKALELRLVADNDIAQRFAELFAVYLEAADQLEAQLFKIEVLRHRRAEVARADKDRLVAVVQPEDVAYLLFKLADAIAVALLTEAAEAVYSAADAL